MEDPVQGDNGTPIEEIEPRLRLGHLIRRHLDTSFKSVSWLAEAIEVPESALNDVMRGMSTLKAEKLKAVADALGMRYDPFLLAARDWNRAVFEEQGRGGVQLSEVTVTERALRGGEELLERELIRAADELAFVANVARETAIRAERAALRARACLRERGVPIPEPPPEQTVMCSGPRHDDPHGDGIIRPAMRLGRDFVISYEVPGEGNEPKLYFCSEECAHEYRVAWGLAPMPKQDEG